MSHARANHTRENFRTVAAEKRPRQKFEGGTQAFALVLVRDQNMVVVKVNCIKRFPMKHALEVNPKVFLASKF